MGEYKPYTYIVKRTFTVVKDEDTPDGEPSYGSVVEMVQKHFYNDIDAQRFAEQMMLDDRNINAIHIVNIISTATKTVKWG